MEAVARGFAQAGKSELCMSRNRLADVQIVSSCSGELCSFELLRCERLVVLSTVQESALGIRQNEESERDGLNGFALIETILQGICPMWKHLLYVVTYRGRAKHKALAKVRLRALSQ